MKNILTNKLFLTYSPCTLKDIDSITLSNAFAVSSDVKQITPYSVAFLLILKPSFSLDLPFVVVLITISTSPFCIASKTL